jgi:hypothetical protein
MGGEENRWARCRGGSAAWFADFEDDSLSAAAVLCCRSRVLPHPLVRQPQADLLIGVAGRFASSFVHAASVCRRSDKAKKGAVGLTHTLVVS